MGSVIVWAASSDLGSNKLQHGFRLPERPPGSRERRGWLWLWARSRSQPTTLMMPRIITFRPRHRISPLTSAFLERRNFSRLEYPSTKAPLYSGPRGATPSMRLVFGRALQGSAGTIARAAPDSADQFFSVSRFNTLVASRFPP